MVRSHRLVGDTVTADLPVASIVVHASRVGEPSTQRYERVTLTAVFVEANRKSSSRPLTVSAVSASSSTQPAADEPRVLASPLIVTAVSACAETVSARPVWGLVMPARTSSFASFSWNVAWMLLFPMLHVSFSASIEAKAAPGPVWRVREGGCAWAWGTAGFPLEVARMRLSTPRRRRGRVTRDHRLHGIERWVYLRTA
jgi:hypothetical protein